MCICLSFHAQDDAPVLIFSGKVSDYSGKKLQGVKVIVKQDGKPFHQTVTSPSGKYNDIEAPFGHQYSLVFEKSGMVSKTLILDTKKGYFEEDVEPRTFIEPSISLFKEQPDVDYSIIENQPVGKARIDPSSGKLDWDYAFSGQRKKEIERYLKQIENQERQQEAQFKKMVTEGNSAYNKENYELAILKYEEALKIKPDDVVSQKIVSAKKNLDLQKNQKELQKQYDALIQKGNNALSSNSFDPATDFYTQAKNLLPGNQLAYDKLREVDDKKKALQDAEINKQYTAKMNEAQKAYESKNWDTAKQLYNAASAIKPSERTPRDRINEIDNMLSNMQADEENYNKLITKADKQLTEKDFDNAISNYTSALKIKPDEAHPKDQIAKAQADKKAAEAQAEIDRKYDNLIKTADNQLKNLSYDLAKATYGQAAALKDTEAYPKDQIALIDQKLTDLEAEKQRLAKLKQEYDAEILIADQLYNDEKWQEAIDSYNKALTFKDDETYPENRINDINLKLKHLAAVEKDKKNRYDESINSANAAFNTQSWKMAKQYYNDALSVFENEKYPADQIVLIDQKILEEENLKKQNAEKNQQFESLLNEGDDLLNSQSFSDARAKYIAAKDLFPNRVIVDQKLTHLQTILDQINSKRVKDSSYNALITKADQLRDTEKWKDAKEVYHDALLVKPLESYPQEQIEIIENKIASNESANIRTQYDDFITKADQFFTDKSYKEAMSFYDQANEILPSEVYPLDKIREIKRIFSDEEAQENQYKVLINQADNEYESENWKQSLLHYTQAKAIFDREYPNKRIEELNQILSDLQTAEQSDQKKRVEFNQIINDADGLLAQKKYNEAKTKYNEALALYENEYYPKKKIAEIDVILEELNGEQETIDKYNQIITNADALRDSKKWEEAKKLYLEANAVIPSNPYPGEQIKFINEQMKGETDAEFKVQYDKLIAAADDKFNAKDYQKAKELYLRARSMNPEDSYPGQKLSEINQILIEMASNKVDDEKFKVNQEKYNQLIKKADAARNNKDWNKAKDYYIQANKTLPSETYPQEQIDIINNSMKDSAVEEIEKQYNKLIDVADKMFQDEKYDKAINLYRRAQSIKPDDAYPPEQIKKVEEAKMIALNNDKNQQQFGLLIKEGKRAFSAKNYRLALKKFQESLEIKPEAKFPIDKIEEINQILDASSKKANKQDADLANNNTTRSANTTLYYGEEVTGKYNEDQIDAILNQGRIDDVDNRGGSAEDNKDMQGNFVLQNTQRQEQSTLFHNQQLGIISENIDRSFDNSNDSRWKVIPQIDLYKDQNSFLKNEANTFSIDKTLRNTENISRMTTNEVNLSLLRDEKLFSNNSAAEKFFDEKMVLDMDLIERGYSSTYDNLVDKEMIYNEVELENLQRKQNRNMLLVDVNNFKENLAIINETDLGHNKNITYTNYESNESLVTKLTESFNFSDNPRTDKIIPSFDYYKDDLLSKNNVTNLKGINSTYDQFKGTESLTAKINDFAIDADLSREENAINVNRYLDKESSKVSVWSDVNEDKSYGVHLVNERVNDQSQLQGKEQESNRDMNISEQEVYNDQYLKDKNDLADLSEKSNYMNAQQLEQSKALKATSNTDKNTQQLAVDYPEGITEKLFERKNTSGQVIEVTILRIVVRGNKGDEYRKVKSKWGESFFKNGGVTSEYIWDTETN